MFSSSQSRGEPAMPPRSNEEAIPDTRTSDTRTSDLVQGTLEMLILKTLALESNHGYGVALRIEQISNGVFRVNPGSLFPALARLERAPRIKAEWRATENK